MVLGALGWLSRVAVAQRSPTRAARSVQLNAGIKKAGLMGGTHRFLAFQRPLRGHTHRFLATRSTVTCRLHGYYRVPGLREGSELGRTGVRHGITCVWTWYRRVLAGKKV